MERDKKIEMLIFQCRNGSNREKCSAIADLQEMKAIDALPVLIDLLTFPDSGVRANSAYALGELGNQTVGPALESLLNDPDAMVRIKAAESLGLLHHVASIKGLAYTLHTDNDFLVRVHAAEALGRMHNDEALPPLLTALNDPDETVRAYTADAIGNSGNAEVLPVLIEKTDAERSAFTKAFLLSSLYRLGNTNALVELIELSETVNDDLAITILNLAADLANIQNAGSLIEMIRKVTQSRPALYNESVAILNRISAFDRDLDAM